MMILRLGRELVALQSLLHFALSLKSVMLKSSRLRRRLMERPTQTSRGCKMRLSYLN
jgi:hypothetical protein